MLRFLGFITFIALMVFVIGLFAGWFSCVDVKSGERQDVTMRIDKKEIENDIDDVKRSVEELGTKPDERRITGDLIAADAATMEIELRSEGEGTVRWSVAGGAAITLDGEKASLAQLRPGDRVVIRVIEEKREVTRIDATRVG